ncbi:MAG: hypothetical protein WC683_06085 [bacterium]
MTLDDATAFLERLSATRGYGPIIRAVIPWLPVLIRMPEQKFCLWLGQFEEGNTDYCVALAEHCGNMTEREKRDISRKAQHLMNAAVMAMDDVRWEAVAWILRVVKTVVDCVKG